MEFLRKVWQDIRQGENLDLYATVAVSIVLVILNILGIALSLTAPLRVCKRIISRTCGIIRRSWNKETAL
jgi:hypothetical protein